MIRTLHDGARGFDTAARLTPQALDLAQEDGIDFVAKYAPYKRSTPTTKDWTNAEISMCFAREIDVLAISERNELRPLGGAPVGAADGVADRASMRALGYPDDLYIISAVDYNVVKDNLRPTMDYVTAFAAKAGGGIATYADEDVADALLAVEGGDKAAVMFPSAWSWSRSMLSAGSVAKRVELARNIPGCVMYQHFSRTLYGLHVDPLQVLAPLRVWSSRPEPPVVVVEVEPAPIVVTPPPASQEDQMATAHITVEGAYAQFYGTGTKLADGHVHCLAVTWSGAPDDGAVDNAFMRNHGALPDMVEEHYSMDTMKGLVLLGDPADIQDSLHTWTRDDFHAVAG